MFYTVYYFLLSSLNCFVHECSHKLFNIWSWNLLVWIGILCTCAEPMSFFLNMHERGCAWLCELSNSFETALTFILFHISLSKLTFRCISMLPTETCQIIMKSRACTHAKLWLTKTNVAVASTVLDIIYWFLGWMLLWVNVVLWYMYIWFFFKFTCMHVGNNLIGRFLRWI